MLEEKYLTTENMWVLDLPKFLQGPVFAVVHFFDRVKRTCEYIKFLWKSKSMLDLDYYEFIALTDFKLKRMQRQMDCIGNIKASKQIEQARMYLDQYWNAETYVTVPDKFKDKTITDFFDISLGEGDEVLLNSRLDEKDSEEYTNYLAQVQDYAEESWDLYWKTLKENICDWA